MNRKERVLAALRGEKTDRVPVSFWRHFRDETGNPPMGRKSAQYHLDFFRETGVDFVKIMYDGFSAPFAFDKVETVTDLVRAVASGPKEDYVRDLYERAAWTCELLGEEVCLYFNVFGCALVDEVQQLFLCGCIILRVVQLLLSLIHIWTGCACRASAVAKDKERV